MLYINKECKFFITTNDRCYWNFTNNGNWFHKFQEYCVDQSFIAELEPLLLFKSQGCTQDVGGYISIMEEIPSYCSPFRKMSNRYWEEKMFPRKWSMKVCIFMTIVTPETITRTLKCKYLLTINIQMYWRFIQRF